MTEREQSILLQAPRDTIFDLLMDVSNLPRLVPIVQNTTAEPGDRVRIQGSVQGHYFVADGYVRVVDVLRRLEWGFGGEGSCSGWVQVDGDDDAPAAWVTAHVSIPVGLILTLSREEADSVGAVLAASLGALRRLIDVEHPTMAGASRCAASGEVADARPDSLHPHLRRVHGDRAAADSTVGRDSGAVARTGAPGRSPGARRALRAALLRVPCCRRTQL